MLPAIAYLPEYSYELGYAHVLFVWDLERRRQKLKPRKRQPLTDAAGLLFEPGQIIELSPKTAPQDQDTF